MENDWTLDGEEFERRLREVGALGDCRACGSERLDPTLFGIEGAGGPMKLYAAICPTCGHVEWFTPMVLKA